MSVFFYQYKELHREEAVKPPTLQKKIKHRYFEDHLLEIIGTKRTDPLLPVLMGKPQPNHKSPPHLILHRDRVPNFANMKKRSLAGGCGVGVFIICFVTIVIAFSTPRWLVSDQRITSAKLDGLGLWVHCFRSLPDVKDDFQRRFFVGCRWVYDPFTTGYDEIRGFLLPWFMIVTQFFYTLALIGALLGLVLVLLFFLCAGPDLSWYVRLIRSISWLLLATGICASFGVIIFACFGNRNNWMPEHANNWFGEWQRMRRILILNNS